MNAHLEQLEPSLLWHHFRTFCNTPRPSFHEEAILSEIEAWAERRGFTHERDQANNLRICKPASPGCEQAPGVVLQGHVDMVSEQDADVAHNFLTDPIKTVVKDGWLTAQGTTLGADNGIGAAAGIAILDDDSIEHGPLELLLTVSEEVSLVGAANLAPNWLQGRLLLNLDTEEDNVVTIGCAGGANVETRTQLPQSATDSSHSELEITVDGLNGGHSGIDINTGRASANRLLARSLHALLPHEPRLASYDGGRMDNAITRTAKAVISVPDEAVDKIKTRLQTLQTTFRQELAEVDPDVRVGCTGAQAAQALSDADSRRLVNLLYALPFGVERMSLAAPGVVETSNNIGVIQLHDGQFAAQLMVRSLVDSARDALVDRITILFELAGFPGTRSRGYPGWAPHADSALLQRFVDVHQRITGNKPAIEVIHAGLECGLIGAHYPDMDMISFGPVIRGAHSPTERADLASVATFHELLQALITDLAHA